MKVICCAGALSARRVVCSPSSSSSSSSSFEEKVGMEGDEGGSAKEERVEDESWTGERKRGRKRGARNRKKGRNAQGKSVISFCACGYDISNRLEGPFFFFFFFFYLFSVPPATLSLFLPSSSTPLKKVARLSPELCRRQGRPGGEWGGRWLSRGNGDAN